MSLIVRKFPIKIKKKYRNALILTQDTSNQSCRVRLAHVRTERYILIVSTLRVNYFENWRIFRIKNFWNFFNWKFSGWIRNIG